MNIIDPATLRQKIQAKEDIILIDVRETWEHEMFNIGGISIPLNTIFEFLEKIPAEKPVVVYCEKGIRSMMAVQRLSEKHGYKNLINLSGGMTAWKKEFHP